MDAKQMKRALDDATARAQAAVDSEIGQLRAQFGPLVEINVEKSWFHGPNRIEFRAQLSSNFPEYEGE